MVYDVYGNAIETGGGGSKNPWEVNGVLNALKIAEQQAKISWTTTNSGMPKASDSQTIEEGTTTTGLPYSSASVEDGYVGLGISLYTFMCAVHNPNSVLYTESSKGYTGYAYYGTVCTSLVCAAWGLPCLLTTAAFPKCDFIKEVAFSDVEPGDMTLGNGHARLITDVLRDSSGNITSVEITESVRPNIARHTYSYDAFVSYNSGYTAYRFVNINSVEAYKPDPFIKIMDEPAASGAYPDVMTNFGDKVTRKYGTDIKIQVLDSTGYSTFKVFRNGAQINSGTVRSFTMYAPDPGMYEVRIEGPGKSSSTYFDIVDCHISVDGNKLMFSTNYDAIAVGGFPVYTEDADGKALSWNNPKRVRFVTAAENVEREIDITEFLLDQADCGGGIRLYVNGAYGSVSFEYKYA